MRIGHHVAVGGEHEARADAALLRLVVFVTRATAPRLLRVVGQRNAKAAEELAHLLVDLAAAGLRSVRAALGGANIDHRRADTLDQLGEVRQLAHLRLRRSGGATRGQREGKRESGQRRYARRSRKAGDGTARWSVMVSVAGLQLTISARGAQQDDKKLSGDSTVRSSAAANCLNVAIGTSPITVTQCGPSALHQRVRGAKRGGACVLAAPDEGAR